MARRDAEHALVGRRVVQRLRDVGCREERGQVPHVQVGFDEVGERERRRRVRGAARPGGVEHGARAREVAHHRDAAAHLDDGRVAAGPGREVAQGAAARREQAHPQLLVGGAAHAEDRDPRLVVGLHDADFVGAPVTDRPQRIRVAPQKLGTHRVYRFALCSHGTRGTEGNGPGGGTAPPHQPAHRRLHRLWTTKGSPCCHEGGPKEGTRRREGASEK